MTARFGFLLGVVVACGFATPAQSGTVAVSLSLPSFAQITGLNDVVFNIASLVSDATSAQSNCTWSNSLTRSYTVTAQGSGAGSAFLLTSSAGATVPYSVGWAGTSGASSTTSLSANVPSSSFTTSALVPACLVGPSTSSTLTVTLKAGDLQSMTAGLAYTGALTLIITPS